MRSFVWHVRAPHVLAKLGLGEWMWVQTLATLYLIEEQLQCKVREHEGVETRKSKKKNAANCQRSFSLNGTHRLELTLSSQPIPFFLHTKHCWACCAVERGRCECVYWSWWGNRKPPRPAERGRCECVYWSWWGNRKTAATVAMKLAAGVVSEGFISLSYVGRCRLSWMSLFVGVNRAL
jgi:hypothetical protein